MDRSLRDHRARGWQRSPPSTPPLCSWLLTNLCLFIDLSAPRRATASVFLGREAKASMRPLVVASFPTEKRVSLPFTHLFEQLVELIT